MQISDFKGQRPLGSGTSRVVYAYNDDVAKCAKDDKGRAQNLEEYSIYKYAFSHVGILCPVRDITPDDRILIMGRALPITKTQEMDESLREKVREHKRKLKLVDQMYDLCRSPHWTTEMQRFCETQFYEDVEHLISNYTLQIGDIIRPSSWGYYKDRFVLIDFGFTAAVLKQYYKSAKKRS